MSRLAYALVLSVLLNLGFIGTAAWRAVHATAPDLPDYLSLNADQRTAWRQAEKSFLGEFDEAAAEILAHRERLVRAIFNGDGDAQRIESEREAIARLQERQQGRVIDQFRREASILDARQRRALADLLLRSPSGSGARELHQR